MDCSGLTSKQFKEDFCRKATAQRIPINGSMEITHRCNLRCKHCYLGQQDAIHEQASCRELDTKAILKIIDDITAAGCLYFLITGGDPLMRKDFIDIYKHAVKNGLVVKLFTNGTLISDKVVEVLQNFIPQLVDITLYGATADTYEKVTGAPGSYERCILGIEKLLAAKIPVGLKTELLNLNQHELFAMESLAASFGLKFRYDYAVQPCLNGDKTPLQFRIEPEDGVAIDFASEERQKQWVEQSGEISMGLASDKIYDCSAGRMSFHIDPYGNLMPCMTAVLYKYDLLQGSFADGWNNFLPRVFLSKLAPSDFVCSKCPNQALCHFCPAVFYIENGSETVRSEYLCQIGKLRRREINKYKDSIISKQPDEGNASV